uniref:Leucine-rich repeat protein 1 n=1 Tax=Steinernema glaseri TaxID=37863 RepID=A0A1I7Y6A1_9BILA
MHLTCLVNLQPLSCSNTRKVDRPYKATVTLVQRRNPDGKPAHSLIIKAPSQKTKTVPPLHINSDTVTELFTSHVKIGRATITFKKNLSLFINQANPKQLHDLMESIRDILLGRKSQPKSAVPPSMMKSGANPTKPVNLRIESRSQYPMKGFPDGLWELSLAPMNLQKVDRRWFRCTGLRKLEIWGNQLTRDIEFNRRMALVGALRHMQMLTLAEMDIKSFPFDFWENLPKSLVSLDLRNNQLRRVPASVSRLSFLQDLKVDDNEITQICDEVALMPRLLTLTCANNKLQAIPATLQLCRLKTLDLSNNQLVGSGAPERQLCTEVGSLFQMAMAAMRRSRWNVAELVVPREVLRRKYDVVFCFNCNRLVPGDSATKIYKSIPVSKFRSESVCTAGMQANPEIAVYEHHCLSCASKL